MSEVSLGEYFNSILNHTYNKYPAMQKNSPDIQKCETLARFFNWDVDRSRVTTRETDNAVNKFCEAVKVFYDSEEKDCVEAEGIFYQKVQGKNDGTIPDFPIKPELHGAFLKFAEIINGGVGIYTSLGDALKYLPEGNLSVRQLKRSYEVKDGSERTKFYEEMRCSVSGGERIHISTKDMADISVIYLYRDICKSIFEALGQILKNGFALFGDLFGDSLESEEILEKTEERLNVAEQEAWERNESIRMSDLHGRGEYGGGESTNIVIDNRVNKGDYYYDGAEARIPQWFGRCCRGVSEGGRYVSSKNEGIFANLIEQYRVPYACEVSLRANKANPEPYTVDFFYYPIFGNNPVYVEIFGFIGDDVYSDKAYNKISNYYKAGVKMGENLIVFICGHRSLVNTALMHKVLLMSLAGYVPTGPVII